MVPGHIARSTAGLAGTPALEVHLPVARPKTMSWPSLGTLLATTSFEPGFNIDRYAVSSMPYGVHYTLLLQSCLQFVSFAVSCAQS